MAIDQIANESPLVRFRILSASRRLRHHDTLWRVGQRPHHQPDTPPAIKVLSSSFSNYEYLLNSFVEQNPGTSCVTC